MRWEDGLGNPTSSRSRFGDFALIDVMWCDWRWCTMTGRCFCSKWARPQMGWRWWKCSMCASWSHPVQEGSFWFLRSLENNVCTSEPQMIECNYTRTIHRVSNGLPNTTYRDFGIAVRHPLDGPGIYRRGSRTRPYTSWIWDWWRSLGGSRISIDPVDWWLIAVTAHESQPNATQPVRVLAHCFVFCSKGLKNTFSSFGMVPASRRPHGSGWEVVNLCFQQSVRSVKRQKR